MLSYALEVWMTLSAPNSQQLQTEQTNLLKAEMAAVLAEYRTESGRTLRALLDESPLLLIFLRHFGCSFCRQTLEDVARIRGATEAKGIWPVFVHLGTPERA